MYEGITVAQSAPEIISLPRTLFVVFVPTAVYMLGTTMKPGPF